MSRKSKKRRAKTRKPPAPARFSLGTQVRVKNGTTDPDFPDIPLGGWSGTISDVDDRSNPPTCLIEWDRRTLAAMHPVYRKRCERDGLEADSMWLGEDDIEPDIGESVPIEQPTQIIVRPPRAFGCHTPVSLLRKPFRGNRLHAGPQASRPI